MILENWALPITTLDGKLLGIELTTRVLVNDCRVLNVSCMSGDYLRHAVHQEQLRQAERKAAWFKENDLLCVLSSDIGTRYEELPFIRYIGSKGDWLDDLGSHSSTAIPLITGNYEVVRLNKRYTLENIGRPIFPILVKNIRKYCDKVIIQVHDTAYHQLLKEAGVWAVQGVYKPIRFEHCEKLL